MFKKVSLHGFKSFCDRTEVTFGTGITAIVGPNGCGKSNLVDALRWVLGEQNPRLLRCNKLEDLIFSGTNKRKAMGMAEVRLLLEGVTNCSELELMRRFTRDGSSEYRINDKTCRYKDVHELLLGTGLSHTGYVVIGQGTIQELAGGNPEDRRIWIEEASGVSRFRLDKKEVESKLSVAARDMTRIGDLLLELRDRQASLYKDWQTAKMYQDLLKEKDDIELAMWLHLESEQSRQVQNVRKRLARYRVEIDDLRASTDALEKHVRCLNRDLNLLEEALSDYLKEKESLIARSSSLKKERDELNGKLSSVSRELQTRLERKESLESDLKDVSARKESLLKRQEELAKAYEELVEDLKAVQEEKKGFEDTWKSLSGKVMDLRSEVAGLNHRLGALDKDIDKLEQQLAVKQREMIEIKGKVADLQGRLSVLQADREKLEQDLHEALYLQVESAQHCASFEDRVRVVRVSLEEAISLGRSLESEISLAKSRKELLQEMEASFEGYGKGPRTILSAKERNLLPGVIGAVGEILSCEEKYTKAVTSAAGIAIENIVVRDENVARAGVEYLKREKGGRCTFLPLTSLQGRNMHEKAQYALSAMKNVCPLISVVKCPPDLTVCAEYLFGDMVLADTMEDGLAFMKLSSWTTPVVTSDGEIIEPSGVITGGEPLVHEGIFLRKREIESLTHEICEKEIKVAENNELVESLRLELLTKEAELDDAEKHRFAIDSQIAALRKAISDLETDLHLSAGELQALETHIQPIEFSQEDLTLRLKHLQAERENLASKISAKEEELVSYEGQIKSILSSSQDYNDKIQDITSATQKMEKELSSILAQIESLKGQQISIGRNLENEKEEISRLSQLRVDLLPKISSLQKEIDALYELEKDLENRIHGTKEQIEAVKQRYADAPLELESKKAQFSYLESRIADAEDELENLEKLLAETKQVLLSKYGLSNPGDYDHLRISRQDALSRMEELESEILSLGTVNLKAEKDYLDLSERIELIEKEKTDVEMAMDELEQTRQLIDRKIHQQFMETFEKVDESFQRIFKELFGGGRGKLNIVDDSMGIEVIAEPPGRRHKQFELLSGGERSLCGIALIFALLSTNPSPVMVLDEVDSSLDEANIVRFAQLLRGYSEDTQFVVVTHQEATMEVADIIYGVTMEEPGVSKVFSMRLADG